VRRFGRLLGKHIADNHGIRIDSINYAPSDPLLRISNPQFMTTRADAWHGPRVRHRKQPAHLDQPEKKSHGSARFVGKWGSLDLAVQPY
jgi:hypothetical protein